MPGIARTVSLTEKGRQIFVSLSLSLSLFRSHTALIQRAFQDVSLEEVNTLTWCSKKIGKRAEGLAERKGRSQRG